VRISDRPVETGIAAVVVSRSMPASRDPRGSPHYPAFFDRAAVRTGRSTFFGASFAPLPLIGSSISR